MDKEGLLGVWYDADGGTLIQVLGMNYIGNQRRLASGGE